MPVIVDEENTPKPFVSSHSRGIAASRSPQILLSKRIGSRDMVHSPDCCSRLPTRPVQPVWWLGADNRTVVAVEVLVEQRQVPPVRIAVIAAIVAVYRTPALFVLEKNGRQ